MAEIKISTHISDVEEEESLDISGKEEEGSTDISGDKEQGLDEERRRLTANKDSCTEQGVSPPESSDQTETIDQERKRSRNNISIKQTDPLSDLTKDQRVVLYTLYLFAHDNGDVYLDDDVTMGDIDFWETLSELEARGLVRRVDDNVFIRTNRQTEIVRSYMENCLLTDIDRDFYLQDASDWSLHRYKDVYIRPFADTEQSGNTPITWMRLLMEGRLPFTLDAIKRYIIITSSGDFMSSGICGARSVMAEYCKYM